MKPMLAASTKPEDIARIVRLFPFYGSAKIDGVRAIIVDGVVMSRTMKPIPNRHVQKLFGRPEFNGLDGELGVGPLFHKNLMQATMSGVMSEDGKPDVTFNVFDKHDAGGPFMDRYMKALAVVQRSSAPSVVMVPHVMLKTEADLIRYETDTLALGYEGVMLRHPMGLYKEGRSTLNQAWLVKVKRFTDGEAKVIGAIELVRKDGKTLGGCLGAFEVRDIKTGVVFDVGTGYSQEQREKFWKTPDLCIGRIIKYKHFVIGSVDKPRFPVFLGFRDRRDI